ncbi:MAG TPA: hypothetical protein VN176_18935 [Verrucomicrobiae bacterium]|jgi:hypothetical protein|nr:hypothetical protein [Verrucomicrobiae bacterium]
MKTPTNLNGNNLATWLQTATELRMADLYTITLKSGTVLRYTTWDSSLTVLGNTFLTGPPNIERTHIEEKRVCETAVVRVSYQNKFSRGTLNSQIDRRVHAAVRLPFIADREKWFPRSDQLPRAVCAAVVHDHPFEIAKGLSTQALVCFRKQRGAVESWRKDRESHLPIATGPKRDCRCHLTKGVPQI